MFSISACIVEVAHRLGDGEFQSAHVIVRGSSCICMYLWMYRKGLLFLIFINDLPQSLSPKVRLFAGDAILYYEVTTPE